MHADEEEPPEIPAVNPILFAIAIAVFLVLAVPVNLVLAVVRPDLCDLKQLLALAWGLISNRPGRNP